MTRPERGLATWLWSGKSDIRETSLEVAAEQTIPPLKQVMRKFVRLVHPDLFSLHPKERDINQKSLTELMTFVETWRNRPSGKKLGRTSTQTVFFFLHDLPEDAEAPQGSETDASTPSTTVSPPLRKIKVDLLTNGAFSEVKSRLVNLFREANVAHDFEVEGIQFDPSDAQDLSTFFDGSLASAQERSRVEKEAQNLISSGMTFLKVLNVTVLTNEFWQLQSSPDV